MAIPLKVAVEGMGDNYKAVDSTNNEGIVIKGKEKFEFTLASIEVKVNGKDAYLHVKESKGITTPTDLQVIKIGSDLFVPMETLTQLFGYEVKVVKKGEVYIVYIGTFKEPTKPVDKEDQFVPNHWKKSPTGLYQDVNSKYPLPAGIKPFKAKSKSFTTNYKANIDILVNELGFEKANNVAIMFPYGTSNSMTVRYSEKHKDYQIQLNYWCSCSDEVQIQNLTPYAFKEITRLFFGANSNKVYDIVEKGYKRDKAVLK
ncbi:stalk domain-containing protein [Kurthia sibirica]|uniref:Copper amine oxidase-like N-terminal domain-containing protein n=1 Tax=Kurthia sibirica TaxID=202750 RepID=A0A2U3AF34_9BACL|nr:stalk domain-containing protein [Kurthia sibirica]PWI23124.1 hypothetical protein DEX24_16405 [Kurthia sibirica]GEK35547.1 hypothetical protein KSI01_30800 [Kurthia sibirica]